MKNTDLTPYLHRLDLITETANQIIKDFDWFGSEIIFSGNADKAYEELFCQINKHVSKLIESDYQQLLNLLYRIDVDEKQISKAVSHSGNLSHVISDLIIRREFQKIITRKYFDSKF